MIKYDVYNKNGKMITVAKFANNNNDATRDIWYDDLYHHIEILTNNMKFFDIDFLEIDKVVKSVLEHRRVVGIAKVADGDVYDEKTGRGIARADLLKRYAKAEALVEKRVLEMAVDDICYMKNYMENKFAKNLATMEG